MNDALKTFLLILLVAVAGCQAQAGQKDPKPEAQEQNVIDTLVSGEIKTNSKSLLPTIDDLEMGWELGSDDPKNISSLKEDELLAGTETGFIEGHSRQFSKVSGTDSKNIEAVGFTVYLYSTEGAKKAFEVTNDFLSKGESSYNNTFETARYNPDTSEMELINVTNEITVTYAKLKDPQIGDRSLLGSVSNSQSKLKLYYLVFLEKNVYAGLICFASDPQQAIDNCIKYAKVVEAKI